MECKIQRIAYLILYMIGISWSASGQISDPAMKKLVAKSVGNLPEGTIFLKSYQADVLGKGKEWVEHSISLQSGGKYIFSIADMDHGNSGALVFVYDRSQHKMASNYYNGKIYPAFEFQCRGSGVYKVFIAFKDSRAKKACVAIGRRTN